MLNRIAGIGLQCKCAGERVSSSKGDDDDDTDNADEVEKRQCGSDNSDSEE